MKNRQQPTSNTRPMIEKALATGEWVKDGVDGQGHGILRHLLTGEVVAYPLGSDRFIDYNTPRNVADSIQRISGHVVWKRGSRKPSRKSVRPSGYDPSRSDNEVKMCAEINRLCAELREVDRQIASAPRETRQDAINFKGLLAWRIRVANRLEQLHQPVPELKV